MNEEVCYMLVHFLLLDLVEFCCYFRSLLQKIHMDYIVISRVSKVIQYIMGRVVMLSNTL